MCHLVLLSQWREAVVQQSPREAAKPSSAANASVPVRLSTFFSIDVLSLGV